MHSSMSKFAAAVAIPCFLILPCAQAQTVDPVFAAAGFEVRVLGEPPGVPARGGGVSFKNGDPDTLLVGGEANDPTGAIYEIAVVRDPVTNRISGFSGSATKLADAPNIDGGLTYGPTIENAVSPPGSVLFFTTYDDCRLGQILPGGTSAARFINLCDDLGVDDSTGAVGFVPVGFPGAGQIKITSYSDDSFWSGTVSAAGDGTFHVSTLVETATGLNGPEGFVYIKAGTPGFTADSIVMASYNDSTIKTYEIDGNGNPIVATERLMVDDLTGAIGAALDPITGDFIFVGFDNPVQVYALSGFLPPGEDGVGDARPVPVNSLWSLALMTLGLLLGGWVLGRRRS